MTILETLTTWRDSGIDFSTATWPDPAGGDTTTWIYQPATGLLTRKEYADGNGTDYRYDATNRLQLRTWARDGGLDTTYHYNPGTEELETVNYGDPDTPDLVFTYDRLGRQTTVTDATGTRSFAYDPDSLRLVTETLDADFYQGLQLTRSYDTLGRSTGYSLEDASPEPVEWTASYTYDPTGRLSTVSDGTDTFTYAYTPDSDLLSGLSAPVHSVSYAYESNRDLMTVIDNQVSGSSLSRYGYSYDVLGRRENRQQSGSAFPQTHTDTFAYNLRSEVIGSTNDVLTSPEYAPAYTYDPIGNRHTSTGASSTSYTTNALNQYTTVGAASPVHDFDGNLTSNGSGKSYAWNGENRLKTATSGGTTIDFTYDYQGRLVKKDDGTNTEVYVYDDWNRIATFNVQSSTFNVQCVYLWGLDLSGSMQDAGGVGGLLKEGDWYPTYDANGNIMQKLDGTGTAVMNVDYDLFGNIVSGSLVGEYGFSTKPLVESLELYYYGYRYYDPVAGRWLNRDPVGERGDLNIYSFIGNSSINFWDNFGLSTSNCVSVSFSVSYNLATRAFNTGIPFIFAQVSGDVSLTVSGQKCDECCSDGTTANYYNVSVSVFGSATLTITAGIALSERYSGFEVDVWGGVQGSGGGSVSGSGSFSNGCSGSNGSGTGTLSGTAGLRVGAEASFRVGRWSLGTTGVSGGGSSTVSLPFNFVCTDSSCQSLTWGKATADASLSLSACVFGFCFSKNF